MSESTSHSTARRLARTSRPGRARRGRWVLAVDAVVGRPERDLSGPRADQPPVLVAGLVGERGGDLVQVRAVQVKHWALRDSETSTTRLGRWYATALSWWPQVAPPVNEPTPRWPGGCGSRTTPRTCGGAGGGPAVRTGWCPRDRVGRLPGIRGVYSHVTPAMRQRITDAPQPVDAPLAETVSQATPVLQRPFQRSFQSLRR
jgi:hypothetical protein